jgi:hypothetical protein
VSSAVLAGAALLLALASPSSLLLLETRETVEPRMRMSAVENFILVDVAVVVGLVVRWMCLWIADVRMKRDGENGNGGGFMYSRQRRGNGVD